MSLLAAQLVPALTTVLTCGTGAVLLHRAARRHSAGDTRVESLDAAPGVLRRVKGRFGLLPEPLRQLRREMRHDLRAMRGQIRRQEVHPEVLAWLLGDELRRIEPRRVCFSGMVLRIRRWGLGHDRVATKVRRGEQLTVQRVSCTGRNLRLDLADPAGRTVVLSVVLSGIEVRR